MYQRLATRSLRDYAILRGRSDCCRMQSEWHKKTFFLRFVTDVMSKCFTIALMPQMVVFLEKTRPMKNEPVVTYNHMQEDEPRNYPMHKELEEESLPISLYMILVVDAILVSAIVFFSFTVIF